MNPLNGSKMETSVFVMAWSTVQQSHHCNLSGSHSIMWRLEDRQLIPDDDVAFSLATTKTQNYHLSKTPLALVPLKGQLVLLPVALNCTTICYKNYIYQTLRVNSLSQAQLEVSGQAKSQAVCGLQT